MPGQKLSCVTLASPSRVDAFGASATLTSGGNSLTWPNGSVCIPYSLLQPTTAPLSVLLPAENVWHQVGAAGANKSWFVPPTGNRYLTMGPFKALPKTGSSTVTFSLAIDNTTLDNAALFTLDVYDTLTKRSVVSRSITRKQFKTANRAQDFSLSFVRYAGRNYEYRVYYTSGAKATHDSTTVKQGSALVAKHFPGDTPQYHQLGSGNADRSWTTVSARGASPGQGYLSFGPYTLLNQGTYVVSLDLETDNNMADSTPQVHLDVWDSTASVAAAGYTVTRNAFLKLRQSFPMVFAAKTGHKYEFRVRYIGAAAITHHRTTLFSSPP